jgi:hypothetical protein
MNTPLCFLLAVALAATAAVALDTPQPSPSAANIITVGKQAAANQTKHRSLTQVCRKDAKALCDMSVLAKCLTEKKDKIADPVCKTWIEARASCLADAEKSGKCTPKDLPKVCLKKLTKADVGDSCANSEFYKSFLMYNRWRRRHPVTKAPAGGSTKASATDAPQPPAS